MIDNNIIPEWSAMSTAQKANFIRYAVSAQRRGEPIDLTNLAEAWKQFYGDYQLACGGKLHSEGGNLLSGEDTDSQDLKQPTWSMVDEAGYRSWRSSLPDNLRYTDDNDYDMRGAYKVGMQPIWVEDDKSYHLGSRDPRTGRILKAPHHPSFLMGINPKDNGYFPYTNNKGETYTVPVTAVKREYIEVPFLPQESYAEGGNLFSGTKTNTQNLKDQKIGVRDIISYINKYKAANYWTQDDINYLAGKLHSTGWDPEAILYVIGTESSYNPNAANPVSSARGLAQITNGTASDIFGEKNYKSIMDQYNRKKRTTHDSIDDAFRYYSHIDKLITKNRDNMGYGRLKVNMLAPYATLDTAIKNVNGIYDSLTSNQKKYVASLEKKLGRKATFADLMEMYDKEFNNRDRKKELIEYAPPAVDLDTPVNIPSIIMPTDAIQQQEVPIIPEAATKISYIPTNPVNNYVEATTEKTSGEELAGLKALNAFRNALSFEHTMQDQNQKLYQDQPVWDPLDVINNPSEFFKLKGNGGNLLALGTDDAEDPEEYSGWLSEFNVTPTSSGQYLQGYDGNGRKIYTVDPNQRMSNNFTADRLAKWDEKFKNSQLPNTGEQWANIATGAIGLPMVATSPVTGALVGDLVGDLIIHPIANTVGFGTGYLGNKADKSLGITSTINKVLPNKINLPEGTVGEFVGYPLGRFSKDVGTKLINEDVKNAIVNNVGSALGNSDKFKRFVEVAGQTGDINPLPYMKNYFLKDAWRPKEWPHLKETTKYVFTGKGNPRKAFFAKVPEQYSEFGEGEFLIPNIGTDPTNPRTGYLRAVLFGEEPGTDLIKLGTADDVFIGEHAKTIAERGYDPKKVRVYTTNKSNDFPINDPKVIESAEKAFQEGNIISTSGEGSFKTKTGTYDAGGHRVFTVKDPTSTGYYPAFRQDFTDFSYLPYKQRWLKGSREPGIFTKIGLKAVDEATTPIIVRTGWEEARQPIGMSYVGSEYYNKLVKGLLKANPGILKEIGIGPSL